MKLELQLLRAKIKGLQLESAFCRKMIRKTSHERRSSWWDRKREIGLRSRACLICLAILRNKNISELERPIAHAPFYLINYIFTTFEDLNRKRWSKKELQDLLEKREEK